MRDASSVGQGSMSIRADARNRRTDGLPRKSHLRGRRARPSSLSATAHIFPLHPSRDPSQMEAAQVAPLAPMAPLPPTVVPMTKPLPSGLILRFEGLPPAVAPASSAPLTIGTPPGTPVHMGREGSNSLRGYAKDSPYFRSLGSEAKAGSKGSPGMPPLGLPPPRVDTDEDLMQKQVSGWLDAARVGVMPVGGPSSRRHVPVGRDAGFDES